MWNEERVERLERFWAEGLSATTIANLLGQTTRNAVIGKVHRMGLAERAMTPQRAKIGRRRIKPKALVRPAVPLMCPPKDLLEADLFTVAAEELVIPPKERKTLQMLGDKDCRWPIGDPQSPDFHFCNRQKVAGLSYCEFHARRAFQPPEPRRPAVAPAPVPALEQEVAA